MPRVPDSPEVQEAARRPMLYFPHDADAASDIKCKRLVRRAGMAGYGRWWRLCELMAQMDGHAVPFETAEDREVLAEELQLAPEECQGFVATLADVGLVDAEAASEGRLVSDRMAENALYAGRRSIMARKSAQARWKNSGKK